MQDSFVYQAAPNRVVFGAGSLQQLDAELERLGVSKALIVCTAQQVETAQEIAQSITTRSAGLCPRAVMHTPTDVTAAALGDLKTMAADGIVSVGGGSTIGLAKALSVRSGLPHLAIPTTYAGSEMTPILGETENGMKTTRRDAAILPATTIYDVDLTMGLPLSMSVTSGMNAIAHAVEALYAPDRNPIVTIMAEDAIRRIAAAISKLKENTADREARAMALYGAWLAGSCLGAVSMSIHHKLCHVLGGSFDLPHAETHTVVLPYATASVAEGAPEAMAAICRALGSSGSAAKGLQDLAKLGGAPFSLAQIGMKRAWLDKAADLATANPYWTPRPLHRGQIRILLERAFDGSSPD